MGQTTTIPHYRGLKRSLIATVILLILLIIGFSVWKSWVEYRMTIRSAELQSRGYARALKEHAERAFSEADTALLDTLEHIEEHGGLKAQTGGQLRKVITTHTRNSPQIGAIILVNREGTLFAHSLDTPLKQANVADREYFIHHRDHPADDTPFLSRPVKSRINGKWRFTLSRPVRSPSGEFEGLVAVAFEMEYFQQFYKSLELGNKGRIVIMRKDGGLLITEPFNEQDFLADFSKSHLLTTYLPRAPRGTYHISAGKALLGNAARIISYESLDLFPVVVNANMGTDEVTKAWQESTFKQALLVLAVSCSLVLLLLILLRQMKDIKRAYRRLQEQQQEIAAAASAWRSTFDSVGDAIWVMSLDRTIQRCNKASAEIFGKDLDTIIGSLCCEVAHSNVSPLSSCPFQEMLESRQRATMQLALGERWFEVSVDPVFSDSGDITGAVHILSDITGIKRAEERYRQLVDNLPVVVWQTDENGTVSYISKSVFDVDGFTPEEIYSGGAESMLSRIHADDRERVLTAFKALFTAGVPFDVEFRIRHKDGSWVWLHDFAYGVVHMDGIRVAHGIFSDITARKQAEDEREQLEHQLRQAQKMEAIGHLAGGIAHDFNNLLTPILGYAEMIAARLPSGDPFESKIAGISAAAHKAKDLTKQLLNFGQRQSKAAEVIDLNEVILSFNTILRRTIRESIRIDLVLDPEGSFVKADRSQMEQIILNMTVNAQDAFNGLQGRINIETCNVVMDGENARMHPGMIPGNYVLLSFRDNGCGMSSEVMNHIFEPFFTTKQTGHGTGLGLATVYGIVKQHDAHISVISHVGEGTTFLIYIPSCTLQPLVQQMVSEVTQSRNSGDATILVVEDNEVVREMVCEMLGGIGYTILSASDPQKAVELLAQSTALVDLLVSDVVMPGMSGPELYEQLVARMPDLKVVYISGYPINPSLRGGTLNDEVNYLQKPFTAEALLERVRQVL
jgi:PAS domain S-box-containing protein